jgi:hypothetical protein
VHVGLELADALRREGVRYCLALPCVLGAVSSIEKAAVDTDKDVVIITVCISEPCLTLAYQSDSRLQESVSMPIHNRNGRLVCNTDMVRLDPDELSILSVRLVHTLISFALSRL